jgi:hypothetical protein
MNQLELTTCNLLNQFATSWKFSSNQSQVSPQFNKRIEKEILIVFLHSHTLGVWVVLLMNEAKITLIL